MIEAFPWDSPPKYLLRDPDGIYGFRFQRRVTNMGFEDVLIAPRSPWQSPYIERLIGTIRRECLDDIIVFNERHLRRVLVSYLRYYHRWRVHQSLEMDCPEPRAIQSLDLGRVTEIPEVDGLHLLQDGRPPLARG
jgi:transposase InsO family protein